MASSPQALQSIFQKYLPTASSQDATLAGLNLSSGQQSDITSLLSKLNADELANVNNSTLLNTPQGYAAYNATPGVNASITDEHAAALALAKDLGYTEDGFSQIMNDKYAAGYDPGGQYSQANYQTAIENKAISNFPDLFGSNLVGPATYNDPSGYGFNFGLAAAVLAPEFAYALAPAFGGAAAAEGAADAGAGSGAVGSSLLTSAGFPAATQAGVADAIAGTALPAGAGAAGADALGGGGGADATSLVAGPQTPLASEFTTAAPVAAGTDPSVSFGAITPATDGGLNFGSSAIQVSDGGLSDIFGGTTYAPSGIGAGASSGFDLSSLSGAPSPNVSSGGFLDKLLTGAENNLTKNPLGIAASGVGLGLDLLKGNQPVGGQPQLNAEANKLATQGNTLSNYLQTGTLPPGVQASINQALDAAKASIRSQYSARGMSGSSAEAQDIQNAEIQASTQGANVAMQLLNTGINETGLAANIYKEIVNTNLTQDQELSQAIAAFGQSLVGGGALGQKRAA